MIALVDLIDEHPDAVAHDLMRCGARLRDFPSERVTWGDLAVLVRAAQPDSAIYKALNPAWAHTHELELLRGAEFSLRWLVWSKTEAGAKNRDRPEPYRFPWEAEPEGEAIRGDAMTADEAADFLGWTEEMREHLRQLDI